MKEPKEPKQILSPRQQQAEAEKQKILKAAELKLLEELDKKKKEVELLAAQKEQERLEK